MSSPFSQNTRSRGICDAFLMQRDEAIMIVRLISFFIFLSLFTTLLWRSLAELRKRIELGENISVRRKQEWTSCLRFPIPIYDRRDYYCLSCRNKVFFQDFPRYLYPCRGTFYKEPWLKLRIIRESCRDTWHVAIELPLLFLIREVLCSVLGPYIRYSDRILKIFSQPLKAHFKVVPQGWPQPHN